MRKIRINGSSRTIANVDPAMPLLWLLRDQFGLVGSKFGCGAGYCGACTVHVDGVATRSCSIAVGDIADREVTTIEGLVGADGALHPLQTAWMELDVPQCGYCQAGQIMSAAALLKTTPSPGDADIDAAMAGNLCRCGTYWRIRKAIHAAARRPGQKTAEENG